MAYDNFARVQQSLDKKFETFRRDNQDIAAWIEFHASKLNSFAQSLMQSIERYGSLTERQAAAVRNCIARDMQSAKSAAQAPEVAQDKLMAAFNTARQNKLTRLKIRFDGFFCYPANEASMNAGGVYVKSDDREYMGKITNGRFQASRDCSAEMQAAIVRVMADPLTEAVAYGKQTGNCAICGRFLENKESVERGIGPICAGKYGFI